MTTVISDIDTSDSGATTLSERGEPVVVEVLSGTIRVSTDLARLRSGGGVRYREGQTAELEGGWFDRLYATGVNGDALVQVARDMRAGSTSRQFSLSQDALLANAGDDSELSDTTAVPTGGTFGGETDVVTLIRNEDDPNYRITGMGLSIIDNGSGWPASGIDPHLVYVALEIEDSGGSEKNVFLGNLGDTPHFIDEAQRTTLREGDRADIKVAHDLGATYDFRGVINYLPVESDTS